MAKGGSQFAALGLEAQEVVGNTGAPLPGRSTATQRVLKTQTKLHQWAT
jgi:hypothetical protein